jgi:hypothetical protein
MPDLLAPTLDELIAEAEREIRLRRRVYPRRIEKHLMTQDKADRGLELMAAISVALTTQRDAAALDRLEQTLPTERRCEHITGPGTLCCNRAAAGWRICAYHLRTMRQSPGS